MKNLPTEIYYNILDFIPFYAYDISLHDPKYIQNKTFYSKIMKIENIDTRSGDGWSGKDTIDITPSEEELEMAFNTGKYKPVTCKYDEILEKTVFNFPNVASGQSIGHLAGDLMFKINGIYCPETIKKISISIGNQELVTCDNPNEYIIDQHSDYFWIGSIKTSIFHPRFCLTWHDFDFSIYTNLEVIGYKQRTICVGPVNLKRALVDSSLVYIESDNYVQHMGGMVCPTNSEYFNKYGRSEIFTNIFVGEIMDLSKWQKKENEESDYEIACKVLNIGIGEQRERSSRVGCSIM
jgi:hypothetical protein